MRARKIPVEIEYVQLLWSTWSEMCDFLKGSGIGCYIKEGKAVDEVTPILGLKIYTLEGTMLATEGDYIIKGVAGEFYPCKPDIFERTYERIL